MTKQESSNKKSIESFLRGGKSAKKIELDDRQGHSEAIKKRVFCNCVVVSENRVSAANNLCGN